MKYLLLIVIGLCFFCIGMLIRKYYVNQFLIYRDLIRFCEILISQIRFKQDTLKIIIKNNLYLFESDLKGMLIEYFINENQNINSIYITFNDMKLIKQFFNNLGTYDITGEINSINNSKNIFKNELENKKNKNMKISDLSPKLGALAGLLCFIIFM